MSNKQSVIFHIGQSDWCVGETNNTLRVTGQAAIVHPSIVIKYIYTCIRAPVSLLSVCTPSVTRQQLRPHRSSRRPIGRRRRAPHARRPLTPNQLGEKELGGEPELVCTLAHKDHLWLPLFNQNLKPKQTGKPRPPLDFNAMRESGSDSIQLIFTQLRAHTCTLKPIL